MSRIGIYAGTFDPVHSGHISFALQASSAAKLDKVYFLPERRPRGKSGTEHFAHRVAMLNRALKPHPSFEVLELVDASFTVNKTLPYLRQKFDGQQLVFLFGSDVIPSLSSWPSVNKLLKDGELVIGLRNNDDRDSLKQIVEQWDARPKTITIVDSYAPDVSSGTIRRALRTRKTANGLLSSVERYSGNNWLYVSLSHVDTP